MNPKDSRNNKRWGNKFIDKKELKELQWRACKSEFLLPIGNRYEELDKINEGKKGRPYEFPESFIKIQAL